MANPSHESELGKGVASWNRWREQTNHEPVDLSGVDLDSAKLQGCDLLRANLRSATLRGAELQRAHLKDADLTKADIEGTDFEHANARGATFDGVRGRGARFLVTTLRGASFRNADLRDATFYRAYLRQADFSDANLSGARLAKANLERAQCIRANLTGVDLRGASLVGASLDGSDLAGAQVYGVGAWSVSLHEAKQQGMLISRTEDEQPVFVDNLNCAHLVSLMVDNEQTRTFLDSISSRFVLILGRFSEERKPVLDLVRSSIHKWGYAGVVFDFEKPPERTFIEVVKTLAGLSRFVIADLTDPRVVHQELDTILTEFPSVPVRPIIQQGHDIPVTLQDHANRRGLVLPVYRYQDREHLINTLENEVVAPAEARAEELEAMLRDFMRDAYSDASG